MGGSQAVPISVLGKTVKVVTIDQSDGMQGFSPDQSGGFHVELVNQLPVPTSIHWHGLVLPNLMDGVPYVTQEPIPPGGSYKYDFPLKQSGTYWMHSHYGLQEQQLTSAPMIIRTPGQSKLADAEFTVMLSDFSFTSPQEILKGLKGSMSAMHGKGDIKAMNMSKPEGTTLQAGFLLASPGAGTTKLGLGIRGQRTMGALDNTQETRLEAEQPLPERPVQRSLPSLLGGNMAPYTWTINGASYPNRNSLDVKEGERVEIVNTNEAPGSGLVGSHLRGDHFRIPHIVGHLLLVLDLLGFSGVKRIRFPSVTICSTALTARGRISHRPVFTFGISSTSTRKNPFRNGETDWTIKIL